MKGVLRLTKNCSVLLIVLSFAFFITSCDGDEDAPKVMPEVTTAAISNITTTSATGGGNIVSDGNDQITAIGLVYSSTNNTPTTADSKTVVTGSAASFTTELTGLTSGTIYHVRAYATNSVGTVYGSTVDFTTGNSAPTLSDIAIEGDVQIDAILTASYVYDDAENDPEGGTAFKWYSATDESGTGEFLIDDASESTYTIKPSDEFKYIRVAITPKSSSGTVSGIEMKSAFIGPVPEAPESVTFPYNGKNVTYKVIVSSQTGKKWLDRNLGSDRVATSSQDYLAYGDMWQWGRPTDGHQLFTWSNANTGTPINGTTQIPSTTDNPDHSDFIISDSDWRSPPNESLLEINNPCPTGWHIPTNQEWADEKITVLQEGFDRLKLTGVGYRDGSTTSLKLQGWGYYWSSSISYEGYADTFEFSDTRSLSNIGWLTRASGAPCRCLQDSQSQ